MKLKVNVIGLFLGLSLIQVIKADDLDHAYYMRWDRFIKKHPTDVNHVRKTVFDFLVAEENPQFIISGKSSRESRALKINDLFQTGLSMARQGMQSALEKVPANVKQEIQKQENWEKWNLKKSQKGLAISQGAIDYVQKIGDAHLLNKMNSEYSATVNEVEQKKAQLAQKKTHPK